MRKSFIGAVSILTALFLFLTSFQVEAATPTLSELAEKAKYYDAIVDYKDVEKEAIRDVEKIGYNDIEIPIYEWISSSENHSASLASDWSYKEYKDRYYVYPNDNYSEGYDLSKEFHYLYPASRTEVWMETKEVTKEIPYKTKETVSEIVAVSRVKNKAPVYTKTSTKNRLTAKNSKNKTSNVTFPANKKVIKVNSQWYKGTASYHTFKPITTYKAERASTSKATYFNKNGTKKKVTVKKGTKLTKKNGKYYAKVSYTPYKKVNGKWVKQKKKSTNVVVKKSNVSLSKKMKKYSKKRTVYVPAKYVSTNGETVKKTKTVTKYKTVKEFVNVPAVTNYIAWDRREQVGVKIEKEPFTYMEEETYTFIDQEPVYEMREHTLKQTYTNVVDFYSPYNLTRTQLFELLTLSGVNYQLHQGYDKTRKVSGKITVNNQTFSYTFNENTLVELLIFDDGSAINLSYLTVPYLDVTYDSVKINSSGYSIP